jgi:hypothetical protein
VLRIGTFKIPDTNFTQSLNSKYQNSKHFGDWSIGHCILFGFVAWKLEHPMRSVGI